MLTLLSNHKFEKNKGWRMDITIMKQIWNIMKKNAKNVLKFLPKGLTNMGVILSLSKVLKSIFKVIGSGKDRIDFFQVEWFTRG
jgi:hypothetical protein